MGGFFWDIPVELSTMISHIFIATDSQILINMIQGTDAALVPYLASRVGEVADNLEKSGAQLRFCKGLQNLADCGSRDKGHQFKGNPQQKLLESYYTSET